jgi:hypothetical protein
MIGAIFKLNSKQRAWALLGICVLVCIGYYFLRQI